VKLGILWANLGLTVNVYYGLNFTVSKNVRQAMGNCGLNCRVRYIMNVCMVNCKVRYTMVHYSINFKVRHAIVNFWVNCKCIV
jgi:hypothetical protein